MALIKNRLTMVKCYVRWLCNNCGLDRNFFQLVGQVLLIDFELVPVELVSFDLVPTYLLRVKLATVRKNWQ